jgi:hypothetical protein
MHRAHPRRLSVRRRVLVLAAVAVAAVTGVVTIGPADAATVQAGGTCPGGFPNVNQRSVDFWLVNNTFLDLRLDGVQISHGAFFVAPPATIGIGQQACWESANTGIFTGTEGRANYGAFSGDTPSGEVRITWDNPWAGNNHFSCVVPAGLKCVPTPGSGSGNHAHPVFTLGFDF